MDKDLRIVPIQQKDTMSFPKVKSSEVMMQHPFSLLNVAPKGSGKTNLICNLIMNHYKGYFHQIWVCSPTVDNDDKWDVVKATKGLVSKNKLKLKLFDKDDDVKITKDTPKVVHEDTDAARDQMLNEPKDHGKIPENHFYTEMEELQDPLQKQMNEMKHIRSELPESEKKNTKYYADRILVILDDQAGLYRGGVTNNWQINFVIKHRHYNTSLIVVTQAYKAIPKSIRTNCNALICFEVPNSQELKVIYEEWPTNMDEHEWMDAYEQAVEEPFSFLYINTHFPKGHRMFVRFEKSIKLISMSEERPAKRTRTE